MTIVGSADIQFTRSTNYTWIRYADDMNGNGMSSYPEDKPYIGIAYNRTGTISSDNPLDYTWSLFQGPQGIEGPKGANGAPTYTWIKYADNANGLNISDDPTGRTYLGIANNKLTPTESNVYTDYTWALIQGPTGPRGLQGLEGPSGDQGIQGPQGQNGLNSYTHIAYATNSTGTAGFSVSDNIGKTYIGMYVDNTVTDSTVPSKYKWTLIKGSDGAQGIQGPPGVDGKTPYFHIAYATNSTGTAGFSVTESSGKTFIGTYTDFVSSDSTDPTKYSWSSIVGPKGDTGSQGIQGPTGADGKTTYTWVKYATSSTGTGMSDSPTGATYIGLAYNKDTITESTVASDYTWSLIQGPIGPQGVVGPKGIDGVTTYTWVKYGTSSAGAGMSDSPTGATYIGLAYNKTTATESSVASDYTWSLIQGPTGPKGDTGGQGIQGPPGANGAPTYTWLKYADSPTSGMSDDPTGKVYMGIAYNKSTPAESTTYADYSWSLIQGPQGVNGNQGIQGPPGANGVPTYTWVKYGTSSVGANMSDLPTGATYIGLAYNKTSLTESSVASDYTWSLIQGPQGPQGIQGPTGPNGAPTYTWLKYADTPTTGMSDDPTGKVYMGLAYNKTTATESTSYSDYTWSLIQGPKGDQGVVGPKGTDGITTYTWVKYGTSSVGAGMSDSPTGATYIGLAYNKTSITESAVASDYTWSLIQGPAGPTGATGGQGIQGPPGANGAPTYTWLKYADTPTTGMSDTPTGKVYMGLAYNKTTATESTAYSDYAWSLIQGPQGSQGIQGPTGPNGAPTYTWLKYADSPTSGMSDDPTGKKYMGLAYNKTTATESSVYTDYSWSLIQGAAGATGGTGPQGAPGTSQYVHVVYANNAAGTGFTTTPATDSTYMGVANTTSATAPTVNTGYKWSLIKGANGTNGTNGSNGAPGAPTYTWSKYASDEYGGNMSDSPVGKRFVGLAFNKSTTTKSTSASDYTWTPLYDNVRVGGRNLLLNSYPTITNTTYPTIVLNLVGPIAVDTEVTLSIKGQLGTGKTNFGIYNSGGSVSMASIVPSDRNASGIYTKTFKWIVGASTNNTLHIYPMASTVLTDTTIEWVKLEAGNVATDWSPAPEDVQSQIDNKVENGDMEELVSLVSSISTDLNYKAGFGEFDAMRESFNARVALDIEEKEKLALDLAHMDERIELVNTIVGDAKLVTEFIETVITESDEGVYISKGASKTGILIGTDRISFMDNQVEVAYISNQTMQINHGIFVQSATISDFKFEKIPGTTVLAITWVGG